MSESGSLTVDHLRATVERYAAAHSAGDVDAVVSLFAEDAVVHDPVDAPAHVGREAVRAFFAGSHDHLDGLELAITGPIRAVDRYAAVPLRATTTIGEDRWVIDIIDVFTFRDDGLVGTMQAYWTASDLRPAD
jgi:steroid Delta-isomerase